MGDYNNQDFYKKLVLLLNFFKNRPYHLAQYLIENSAFDKDFISKLNSNNKLSEIGDSNIMSNQIHFVDITHMDDYFNSLLDEIKPIGKNNDVYLKELTIKLEECILKENYEEAAKIRDYINRNRINKKK
jgi:hypothetical protein